MSCFQKNHGLVFPEARFFFPTTFLSDSVDLREGLRRCKPVFGRIVGNLNRFRSLRALVRL